MYDAQIGRFPSLDPIAEDFIWVSPYNYAENNPIGNIDLWGLQGKPAKDMGYGLYTTAQDATYKQTKVIKRQTATQDNTAKVSRTASISQYNPSGLNQQFLGKQQRNAEFSQNLDKLNYQQKSLYPTLYRSPESKGAITSGKGYGLMSGLAEGAKDAPYLALPSLGAAKKLNGAKGFAAAVTLDAVEQGVVLQLNDRSLGEIDGWNAFVSGLKLPGATKDLLKSAIAIRLNGDMGVNDGKKLFFDFTQRRLHSIFDKTKKDPHGGALYNLGKKYLRGNTNKAINNEDFNLF